MTVATIERVTILEPIIQPEILTLSPVEIDRILAEAPVMPGMPPDPCLLDDITEGYSDEPITEFQDSMDAAGYPYW